MKYTLLEILKSFVFTIWLKKNFVTTEQTVAKNTLCSTDSLNFNHLKEFSYWIEILKQHRVYFIYNYILSIGFIPLL